MNPFKPVVLCIVIFVAATVQAQTPITLTLEEAIERAQLNSPASQMAELQFEQAYWQRRAFQSEFRPVLSLTGSAPGLFRSITEVQQNDGTLRYLQQSRMLSNAGITLQQEIPLTGGRLFMSSGLSRMDLLGDFATSQWQASPFLIGYAQPIFQFNPLKWDRRIEPLRFRMSERVYAENIAQVALDITDLFFNVAIAQMDVEIATYNVAVNDTIYILSQGRYDLGSIAENDLLQSELALLNAQTALSDAQIAYDRAVQDLKTSLGLPYNADLSIIKPLDAPFVEVDANRAVAEARQNRAVFLNMQITNLQSEREVDRARTSGGFSATLNASYGLNQSAHSLNDVFSNPLNQQRFSVGFQIPIYQSGRRRAEFESALAAQEQTARGLALQREQLEQEVYFEALQLRQLQQQVIIAAKADTIASRRFEVARNRYTIGRIDITNLFDAQVAKDTSTKAYIRTLRQYWISYFRLRRLTLFDFVENEPVRLPER